MTPTVPARAATAAALLALVAGCSSASSNSHTKPAGSPSLTGRITVLAASSLTGAFTTLGKAFEQAHPGVTAVFSFGSSATLAQQAVNGAPADVFAAASPKTMQTVQSAGDAADVQAFAKNIAEIAASTSGAGAGISGVADLARPGVKVVLCDPSVPCGAVAAKVLANAHVSVKPVSLGTDDKTTLAYVTSGQADAAVVYASDLRTPPAGLHAVPIPGDVNASTAYEIATLNQSTNGALAAAFESFVLSSTGQQTLTAAGFTTP